MAASTQRLEPEAARGSNLCVQCHICGEWYRWLVSHVFYAHGMRSVEYRVAFGLKQSTKVASESYRAARRAVVPQR